MTDIHDQTRPASPRVKLEQAIQLAKAGQKAESRQMLRQIVALQPVNQAAWLWLSAVTEEQAEAEAALAQARHINPAHPSLIQAEQWLVHRFSPAPTTRQRPVVGSPTPQPAKESTTPWLHYLNIGAFGLAVAAVGVGLLILFLGLIWEVTVAASMDGVLPGRAPVVGPADIDPAQLAAVEQAWADQNWSQAIALLERMQQAGFSSAFLTDRLVQAYLQKGITLRRRGFVEAALTNFEAARHADALNPQVQRELRLAQAYLAGIDQYQAGQWPAAIRELEIVWAADKEYANVRDLLYSALYNHALALRAADQLAQAQTTLQTAIALRPDLSEPRRVLAEVAYALTAETPLAQPIDSTPVEDRLVLVGIAEQRMWVYEGEERIFDFVVSTGEPGRDTAVGEFEILNKIDMAYASSWNLDMPNWLGIYWAGPLQNGIHSLPIVKHTGYKLWDGYLGQRVSYGCVILSDEDSATLYDWAELGTKVKIVPSLANWQPDR